ncbi:MAG: FecR domain-containing protein, partial [Myxococcota bacterium]
MTDPVLQHYRDALSEGVPQASEAQRAAVLSRLAGSRRQRTQRRAAFGMVAAAAVGLLAWVGLRPADPGITCSQGEQTLAAGAWIRADQDERVSFSDGSHFAVAENASLRLSAMTRDTVEVMVESGAIAVHVEPNGPRRWRFFAGPFEVEVVGTDLEVDWSADQTRLRVGVSHGRVRVHGNGGRVSVSAGEEVEMRTDGHELRTLAEAEPEPVVDSAPEPEVSAPAPAESRVRPTPRPAAPDWRALADDGRFAEACRAGGRG